MPKKHTATHQFTPQFVTSVAALANIPITDEEAAAYGGSFADTMQVVNQLQSVDISNVEPTNQVTGLENVWREDELWPEYMFSQEQALANATHTHNGYIVVNQIIDQED